MEELKLMKTWVMGFPLWEGVLLTDTTEPAPGSCGLFPVGAEQRFCREDVLGNRTLGLRRRYQLRRVALRGEEAAAWILEFCRWAQEAQPPALGERPAVQTQKAMLESAAPAGMATYLVTITVDFEKEYAYGKD